jgi:hypothetical protein
MMMMMMMMMRHIIIAQNPVEAPVVNRKKYSREKSSRDENPQRNTHLWRKKGPAISSLLKLVFLFSIARKLRGFIGGDAASRIVG